LVEKRAKEAELLASRILEDSEQRAREMEILKRELERAREAEILAKTRLATMAAAPTLPVSWISHWPLLVILILY